MFRGILKLTLFFMVFGVSVCYAQKITLSGKVYNARSEPLAYVNLAIEELNLGTFSDLDGRFSLTLPSQNLQLVISSMGYKTQKVLIDSITDLTNVSIILQEDLLELDDIIVTAKKTISQEGTSTYEIGEQAIKQVQAMNLSDVLALLPGNRITPPDLTQPGQANLRSAIQSNANAFGTAIILDGTALSNDANLQAQNPAALTNGGKSQVAGGIDLRSISLANVESVEVISGVASPKYGNLSSGGILVKSKVGASPWITTANVSATNYQASVAKGFEFKKLGLLNTDFSYAYSSGSPTERQTYYQNFNLGLRWKLPVPQESKWNHFTTFRVGHSDDGRRFEPDEINRNEADVKSTSYLFGVSGNVDLSVLGALHYNVSTQVVNQYSYFDSFGNDGPFPIIEALESGTYRTTYAPLVYNEIKEIEGRPVNVNANISISQFAKKDKFKFNFESGLQYTYDKNTGRGRVSSGNIARPQDLIGSRSATFQEIPASKNFSAYHQTRVTRNTEHTTHRLNLGLRYDYMLERYHLLSPRLSLSSAYKTFTARVAWGLAYKAPAMIQLFPGKTFIDYINFNYFSENPAERLAIVTTYVQQPSNEQLRPNYVDMKEVGFDWSPASFTLQATFFRKDLRRGINHTNELLLLPKQNYEVVSTPAGQQPEVVPIPGDITNIPRTIKVLKNNEYVITHGVELVLTPPKIEATGTEFHFRYSYLESILTDTGFDTRRSSFVVGSDQVRFGVYENNRRRRVNSFGTLTLIQHIPSLRFVLTLSTEFNFYQTQGSLDRNLHAFAYYDIEGNYIPIPEGEREDMAFNNLKLDAQSLVPDRTPFHANFNLQVRKETIHGHSFSFFAINAPWYNPTFENQGRRRQLNDRLSVGFNFSLKINSKT
ncbi:MAG: carboxypeptidase-like regulatory domain-containing protein [Bacteroidota bacterium]